MNGLEVRRGKVRSGYPELERALSIGTGIVTIRCAHAQWLFDLVANMMVRNYSAGRRILYMHWVDYHERYWSFDYDRVLGIAKRAGADAEGLSESVIFLRAFSRDNVEVEENWKRTAEAGKFDLIILDSVGELYSEKKEGSKAMTYSIGKFSQLCTRNDCVGIVLDRMGGRLHNYLAHVSSVILEIEVSREIAFTILKHPCMAESSEAFPRDGQYRLARWL
ncbi:MAG TPA: hypothetical protein VLD37_04045 [Candidatus Bilamarchaeum sp.]|nr:hypothetical protein [Candidatus Bilamarchaeum sp.]